MKVVFFSFLFFSFCFMLFMNACKENDDSVTFEVNFETDGGSFVASVKVKHGERLTKPKENPVKRGHVFVGWYKDRAKTVAFNFGVETITSATTLYAKWEVAQYRVTFNVSGGSEVPSVNVPYGQKVTRPAQDPTRPGHTFLGWYKDVDTTEEFDFTEEIVTEVLTIYARWVAPHTITYKLNDGTDNRHTEQTVDTRHATTPPEELPVRAASGGTTYYFGGWYTVTNSPTGKTKYDFATIITRDLTLYARWYTEQPTSKAALQVLVNGDDGADLNRIDVRQLRDISGLFKDRSTFNGDISGWDVSSITNMDNIFSGATVFNQDISGWDVSNVRSMNSMFQNAAAFNQDISRWIVSNVENMDSTFSGADAFNKDISRWDVSNVTSMNATFQNALTFNKDISRWIVSSVTNMDAMFQNAVTFNQNISGWTVSNVRSMNSTFQNATTFNQNISGWTVSNVTSMNSMFQNAAVFNQDISGWIVSNVTSMNSMFQNAAAFSQDISGWNVGKVRGMASMFNGATAFSQNLSGWDVRSVTAHSNFSTSSGLLTAQLPKFDE